MKNPYSIFKSGHPHTGEIPVHISLPNYRKAFIRHTAPTENTIRVLLTQFLPKWTNLVSLPFPWIQREQNHYIPVTTADCTISEQHALDICRVEDIKVAMHEKTKDAKANGHITTYLCQMFSFVWHLKCKSGQLSFNADLPLLKMLSLLGH